MVPDVCQVFPQPDDLLVPFDDAVGQIHVQAPHGVDGIAEVEARDAIDAVAMTIPIGRRVVALPEGERYLGFVFAGGPDADAVEAELRRAAEMLTVLVDGEQVPVLPDQEASGSG